MLLTPSSGCGRFRAWWIMREQHLVLPADLALLFKSLITLEGLGTRFVPHFRLIEHVTPYVQRLLMERWAPRQVAERLSGVTREATRALRAMPRLLEAILMSVSSTQQSLTAWPLAAAGVAISLANSIWLLLSFRRSRRS